MQPTTMFNGYSVPNADPCDEFITEVVETPDGLETIIETDVVNMDLSGEDLDKTFTPAKEDFDPFKMIHEIGKFNPKFANQLWYKLQNQPGTIKVVDGEKYIVSPKGSWVKSSN